jgi:hypothetical protein
MAPALLFSILSGVVSGTAILKQRQKQAYIISLIGYLLSLLTFAAGSWFDLSLNFTLICYSIVLSIYYLVLLYWYRKLILEPAA